MRRILLLSVLLLGSTIIMNGKAIVKGNSTNDLTMVIGTYTGGGSKGIYTYRLDQNTGKAIPLSSVRFQSFLSDPFQQWKIHLCRK
jgi:hypothetical protein